MVEAMHEQSPEYFRHFQKQFRFFTTKDKLDTSHFSMDFSIALHSSEMNQYCNCSNDHYHVIANISDPKCKRYTSKAYAMPCLYTTFRLLLACSPTKTIVGDVFERLERAVNYNRVNDNDESSNLRRKLPSSCLSMRLHTSVQTEFPPQATIDRFIHILRGPHSGKMYQIMDILISGHGKVEFNDEQCCFQLYLTSKSEN